MRRLGRSVLERIGFSGVAKIDFKRDPRTGRLYLLEINPRFNLWHHAGAAAGVSIPALVYRDCLEPGSARPAGRARAGVRWVNARDDWRAYQGSPARWLAEILTADVNESFMLRDPLPGLDDASRNPAPQARSSCLKLALVSDLHGNLEALDAVLRDARSGQPRRAPGVRGRRGRLRARSRGVHRAAAGARRRSA